MTNKIEMSSTEAVKLVLFAKITIKEFRKVSKLVVNKHCSKESLALGFMATTKDTLENLKLTKPTISKLQ